MNSLPLHLLLPPMADSALQLPIVYSTTDAYFILHNVRHEQLFHSAYTSVQMMYDCTKCFSIWKYTICVEYFAIVQMWLLSQREQLQSTMQDMNPFFIQSHNYLFYYIQQYSITLSVSAR